MKENWESEMIVVFGRVNLDYNVNVGKFPIEYDPIRRLPYGISSTVSGIVLNNAVAIKTLGEEVALVTLVAKDSFARVILEFMENLGIGTEYAYPYLDETPECLILYDGEGRRSIMGDSKNFDQVRVQDSRLEKLIDENQYCIFSRANFCKPYMEYAFKSGKEIVCDLQLSSSLTEFNAFFVQNSTILFFSGEQGDYEKFMDEIVSYPHVKIVVCGLGEKGVAYKIQGNRELFIIPGIEQKNVVNSVGAGDSVVSCFTYMISKGYDYHTALKYSVYFASYKIQFKTASEGFLTFEALKKILIIKKGYVIEEYSYNWKN